jgi:AcrR family transcriptional regulator
MAAITGFGKPGGVKSKVLETKRRAAIDAVKRDLIRGAAKKLFSEHGLDATSVRDIAQLAGYTTGAIYFHYLNKEELYADVLRESLDGLFQAVSSAASKASAPLENLASAFRTLIAFYEENPRDLDLSLYLYQGARPRGLTTSLNRDLNSKLMSVLNVFRGCLEQAGVAEVNLAVEVGSLFSEMMGALVTAHTGRLRVIGVDLNAVVEHHIDSFSNRLAGRRKGAHNG